MELDRTLFWLKESARVGCEEAGDQCHGAVLVEMASSSHQYNSPHIDDEDDLIDPDDGELRVESPLERDVSFVVLESDCDCGLDPRSVI